MINYNKIMLKQIIKSIVLTLVWCAVPSLFLFLAYKWQMPCKWLRLVLAMLSPLCLIIYIVLIFAIMNSWDIYKWNHSRDDIYFSNEARLEDITGVRFDIDKIVDYHSDEWDFVGDCYKSTKILLKNRPDCYKLDSLVQEERWEKRGNRYFFTARLGPGEYIPKGDSQTEKKWLEVIAAPDYDTLFVLSGVWGL